MQKLSRAIIIMVISIVAIVLLNACGDKQSNKVSPVKKSRLEMVVRPTTNSWKQSSENKPYPDMSLNQHNWLDVSIKNQRVYIRNKSGKIIYTMLCSTGDDNGTPRGVFHIQAERGSHFYNASSKEGANYWTSFLDHGIYLFHSVPVDQTGHYLMRDAHELGRVANSHGCVRLSVPDAKWLNQNVPTKTKVVIH